MNCKYPYIILLWWYTTEVFDACFLSSLKSHLSLLTLWHRYGTVSSDTVYILCRIVKMYPVSFFLFKSNILKIHACYYHIPYGSFIPTKPSIDGTRRAIIASVMPLAIVMASSKQTLHIFCINFVNCLQCEMQNFNCIFLQVLTSTMYEIIINSILLWDNTVFLFYICGLNYFFKKITYIY